MKIIPIICPNCHANIEVQEGKQYCFCTYCGTKLFLDDESITFVYRDEAKLKELELIEKERAAHEEAEKKRIQELENQKVRYDLWKKKTLRIMILEGLSIAIWAWLMSGVVILSGNQSTPESILIFFVVIIFVEFFVPPIYFSVTRPIKPEEKKPNIFLLSLKMMGINYLMMLLCGCVFTLIIGLIVVLFVNIWRAINPVA